MQETYTERKALQEYLSYLREERRKLSEEYWRVLDRLKQLDNESRVNENPVEIVNSLILAVDEQRKTVDKISSILPKIPASEYIKAINEAASTVVEDEIQEEKIIPTKKIEEQREIDQKRKINQKYYDVKSLANDIAYFLKEKGIPVKLSEINKFMESKGYKVNNPTNTMNQVLQYNNRIERATFGHYQYRF